MGIRLPHEAWVEALDEGAVASRYRASTDDEDGQGRQRWKDDGGGQGEADHGVGGAIECKPME